MIRKSLMLAWLVASGAAVSPGYANDLHHVHLTAANAEEGARWYIRNIGCEAVQGHKDIAKCGDVYLLFLTRASTGPSAGTGVNHIGFSFPNLSATMKKFESSGVKIAEPPLREIPGMFKLAFVEDPWGTRIEVVEDPETLGFHHILLHSNDPDAALNWYHDMCGGQKAKLKGQTDAIRYGKIWLLAVRPTPRDTKLVPTEGRSIDHLGFSFPDLDSAARDFEQRGTKLRQQPQAANNPGVSRAGSLVGPDDVLIEIVQPLPALK